MSEQTPTWTEADEERFFQLAFRYAIGFDTPEDMEELERLQDKRRASLGLPPLDEHSPKGQTP